MNKYQEALDGLKENIENITGIRIETDDEFYEWISTLQELVDRAGTPKKPKNLENIYGEDDTVYKRYDCPNCGKTQESDFHNEYCTYCGQMLDWSGKDE